MRKRDYIGFAMFVSALFWLQKLNSNWTKLSLVQNLESESLGKTRLTQFNLISILIELFFFCRPRNTTTRDWENGTTSLIKKTEK